MNYIRHLNTFFNLLKKDPRLSPTDVSLYMALFQYWNFNRFQSTFPVYRQNLMQLSKIGSKHTYHKCVRQLHKAGYIKYHPALSRYKPVTITMIRLDNREENDQQLMLFGTEPGTIQVPDLPCTGTENDPQQVPKVVPNIKPQTKNNECKIPTQLFKKNKKIQKAINDIAGINKDDGHTPSKNKTVRAIHQQHLATIDIPADINEVEAYFRHHQYSIQEGQKFFYYNQARGWMLSDKLPISDWRSLAQKWMFSLRDSGNLPNIEISHNPAFETPEDILASIKKLYGGYLRKENIFKKITVQHFEYLNLAITPEIRQQAINLRINQLMGTNERSINELLLAYQSSHPDPFLLEKDQPHLLLLSQRLAVLHHFHHLSIQKLEGEMQNVK